MATGPVEVAGGRVPRVVVRCANSDVASELGVRAEPGAGCMTPLKHPKAVLRALLHLAGWRRAEARSAVRVGSPRPAPRTRPPPSDAPAPPPPARNALGGRSAPRHARRSPLWRCGPV